VKAGIDRPTRRTTMPWWMTLTTPYSSAGSLRLHHRTFAVGLSDESKSVVANVGYACLYSWTTLSYESMSQARFAPFYNHRTISSLLGGDRLSVFLDPNEFVQKGWRVPISVRGSFATGMLRSSWVACAGGPHRGPSVC